METIIIESIRISGEGEVEYDPVQKSIQDETFHSRYVP